MPSMRKNINRSSMKKILVIGAHYDDEVLGCAGTIANQIRMGNKVHVHIITDSCTAQYPNQPEKIDKKIEEANKIAKLLGIRYSNSMLPEMSLENMPMPKLASRIDKVIKEKNPDIIYTHYQYDMNTDHRRVYEATMVACRNLFFVPILSYVPDMNWLEPFKPNYFVDITNTWLKKVKAIKCYKTEMRKYPHPRSMKAMMIIAKYWGLFAKCRFAEPFIIVRGGMTYEG